MPPLSSSPTTPSTAGGNSLKSVYEWREYLAEVIADTADDIVTEWHQRITHDVPDTNIKPSHLKTLLLGIQAYIHEPYQQVCPMEEAIKLLSSDLEMVVAMVEEHHFLDQWLFIQVIQKYPDWKRQWNLTAGTFLKDTRKAILKHVQQLTNTSVLDGHEVPFCLPDDGSVNASPKRKKSSKTITLTTKNTSSDCVLKMLNNPLHNEFVSFMRMAQMDDDIIEKVTS